MIVNMLFPHCRPSNMASETVICAINYTIMINKTIGW